MPCLPSAVALHEWVLEVCKALGTHHLSYRAAFANPVQERLPLLKTPALFLTAANDPLAAYTREATAMVTHARFQQLGHSSEPDFTIAFAAAVQGFLAAPEA